MEVGSQAAYIRFPSDVPIQIFQPCESLLVIPREWLAVAIAGIVIPTTSLLRKSDGMQHHQNTEASFWHRRIKHGIHAGRRALAEIQESDAAKLAIEIN